MFYVQAPPFQARGLLSVAEVAFFLPAASEHSCSHVHVHVFVHTHTSCIYVLFFDTMRTHMCLSLTERGLFPRLVEPGGRSGLKPGCSLPTGARVRKVENQVI